MRRAILATALCILCTGFAQAVEITAPFLAGERWTGDRFSSSYHVPPYHDFCVDFNRASGGSTDNGSPILAVADGVITTAGSHPSYGNHIKIDIGGGYSDLYAHMKLLFAVVGQKVQRGQVIGLCGNTGSADGYHLHYGRYNGSYSVEITRIDGQAFDGLETITSRNDGVFDRAESEYASIINNLGGRNGDPHWYYAWAPAQTDNCYKQPYRGTPWLGTVAYDPLNGALKAYPVVKGFYDHWRMNGDGSDIDGDNGPHSDFGMPITAEYTNGTGRKRQDGTKKYYYYNGSTVSVNAYPYGSAPGAFSNGWQGSNSYRIAGAYETNGARNTMGEPMGAVAGVGGGHYRQVFDTGSFGNCYIEFDTNASAYAGLIRNLIQDDGKPVRPISAFVLRTAFKNYWNSQGQYSGVGTPFTDEFPGSGGYASKQWFIRWTGSTWQWVELRWNGSSVSKVVRTWPGQLKGPEDPDSSQEDATTIAGLSLDVFPNPLTQQCEIRLAMPGSNDGNVDVAIFDAAGRKVRSFDFGAGNSAGTRSVMWDRRDDHGMTVASGVYFIRSRVGNATTTKTVTILR